MVAEIQKDPPVINMKATEVPVMKTNQQFVDWRKELEIWIEMNTALNVNRKVQAGVLYQSLSGIPQQIVLSELTVDKIVADDGVENIVSVLKKYLMGNKNKNAYHALDQFMKYRRNLETSIELFLMEFQLKINRVNESGTMLSDGVLVYTLLNSANLSEDKLDLIKLTCEELTYEKVKTQLKKIYLDKSHAKSHGLPSTPKVYGQVNTASSSNNHTVNHFKVTPSETSFEKEVKVDDVSNIYDITLFTDLDYNQLNLLVGETLGKAIIDAGCPHTVAGGLWIKTYLNSLSRRDRSSIRKKASNKTFCFGNGKLYPSQYKAVLPFYIQNSRYELGVDVINLNIPLLFSQKTLKRGNAKVYMESTTMSFIDKTIPLSTSSTGHLCLHISRPLDHLDKESKKVISRLLFTSPIQGIKTDYVNIANALHTQFCHPTAESLIDIIKKVDACDQKLFDAIYNINYSCDVCIRVKKVPLRQVSTVTEFNEVVAIDLKSCGAAGFMMHIIDHLTRYSCAFVLEDIKNETIVNGLLTHWIKVFGFPKCFLTNNKFMNKDMLDVSRKFNINIMMTDATVESAWSIRLVRRHNAVLNNYVNSFLEKGLSLDSAVCYAVAAKNALTNIYGFTPNMLVFGNNQSPSAENVIASTAILSSDCVTEDDNAIHLARNAFIKQESCLRWHRDQIAISQTHSENIFCLGDKVFYWLDNRSHHYGPAIVIGKNNQEFLVKHGGIYIHVHKCKMQLYKASQAIDIKQQTIKSSINLDQSFENDSDEFTTADEGDADDYEVSRTSEAFSFGPVCKSFSKRDKMHKWNIRMSKKPVTVENKGHKSTNKWDHKRKIMTKQKSDHARSSILPIVIS